jgi:hypothetical protein
MTRITALTGTALLALVCVMTGCATKTAPLPTNAINATDAQINSDLQTLRAGLAQYEADVANGTHVPDASEKVFINNLIAASNAADKIYCGAPSADAPCAPGSFHAQLMINPAAGEPQQLIDAMLAITSNLTTLQNLIKVVK